MDINCLILFLCFYQTVRCIHVESDNDNDGEANERIRKLESYGRKEINKEDQNIDSIDPRQYFDSLVQSIIKNAATVIDMTEEQQQYILDLRNKYVQFMNALDKTHNLVTSFDEHQYDKRNIRCARENCSINNFWANNRPQQRPFNRTATWLEHAALRLMFLNTTRKCIERIFGNIEISINVERRENDFYIWAIIPQKGKNNLKLMKRKPKIVFLNETTAGFEIIKSDSGMKSRIITEEYVSFDNQTGNEKFENSTESMIAINGTNFSISTITLPNLPEVPISTTWWNSIWFWTIHFIALILFIILLLSCFIWHFGSSNKHSDYIRI